MTAQAKLTAAIGLLLVLIFSHLYAYHAGDRNGTNAERVKNQSAAIARQDRTISALQAAAAENQRLATQQAADAKQETLNHEKEIAALHARLHADAARRVRIDPAKFCPGHTTSPAKAATAGGDGQADASPAFLPEPFASNLRQLAADADEVTADLRTLKARVEKAGCFAE